MGANLVTGLHCILALLQHCPVVHSPASGVVLSPLGVAAGVMACATALVTLAVLAMLMTLVTVLVSMVT